MSVINKMLRDLDSRQATGAVPALNPQSRTGIARDTLIVNDSEPASRRPGLPGWALLITAGVVLLAVAAGVWWYLHQKVSAPPKVTPVQLAPKAAPAKPVIAVAPSPAPLVAASGTAAAPLPAVAVPVPVASTPVAPVLANQLGVALADMSLRMDSNVKLLPNPAKTSKPKPAAMTRPVAAPKAVKERPSSAKAVKSAASAPAPATLVPPHPSRQAPVQEALAQAQSLWSSGSHQAAIDLLYEALATAERANAVDASAANKAVLASLVRELARMELAEGRVSQTLELLKRLEPALSGVADIWAIRGNAAQRLGRHAESVAAYQMALKLRPNELRWMLGAAVSLAAQGQTAAAAELAEKARAGGALTPELATYLRQLGVPLR